MMARRDGSAARRWDDEHEERAPEPSPVTRDPRQLVLDPLLDEDLRRLRQDFAFARAMLEAMIAHEPVTVRQLLANPAALRLPRPVREEAQLFASLSRSSLRAPMQALQHHGRLAQLLAERLGVAVERVLRSGGV
jgi:hypothetical protein